MSIYLQEQNTKQLPLTVRTFETWSARTWLNKVQLLLKKHETTRDKFELEFSGLSEPEL